MKKKKKRKKKKGKKKKRKKVWKAMADSARASKNVTSPREYDS